MKLIKVLLKGSVLSVFMFLSVVSFAQAKERVSTYNFPDIKDRLCGTTIDYRYCKCAFHDQYCGAIGLTKGTANEYVWNKYREYVRIAINRKGESCEKHDGIWSSSRRSCTTCYDGEVKKGNICVDEEDVDEDEDVADEANKKDCEGLDNFDRDWLKYSDIDERLGSGDRSYEAQQYAGVMESLVETKGWIFEVEARRHIERVKRIEMQAMHDALVKNQTANLLKAFWRLTYITYATIDSSKGVAGDLVGSIGADNVLTMVSKGVKFIQANTPGDSAIAIDTKKMKGKVRSVGVNGALEAIDSLGDPVKIVTKIVADSVKATYPSADISKEEIAILRSQYLLNHKLDVQIQESRRQTILDSAMIRSLKKDEAQYQAQADAWKSKEKARVKDMIKISCEEE